MLKQTDEIQQYKYHLERWKEDCRKAEMEAAVLRKQVLALKQELENSKIKYQFEIEALRNQYERKINEMLSNSSSGRLVSFDSDLKGVFAKIQSTTLKIEKLLGVADSGELISTAKELVEVPIEPAAEEESVSEAAADDVEPSETVEAEEKMEQVQDENNSESQLQDLIDIINKM